MEKDPLELGAKHNITLEVLLVRDDHLVCALPGQKSGHYTHKFTIPLPSSLKHVEPGEPVAGITVVGTEAPKRQRAPKGESKIDKCTTYYKAHPGLEKDEYIKVFVNEFGCTPQGANTYFHTCRKM